MPIQFKCTCGRALAVADQHAGKRIKCPQCGQVVQVPGGPPRSGSKPGSGGASKSGGGGAAAGGGRPKKSGDGGIRLDDLAAMEQAAASGPVELAPASAPRARAAAKAAPNAAPAAGASQQGYETPFNRPTGDEPHARRPVRVLPVGKIVALLVLVGTAVGVWWLLSAMTGAAVFSAAIEEFEQGRLRFAVDKLRQIKQKASGQNLAEAEKWLKIIQLEQTNNIGGTLSNGDPVFHEHVTLGIDDPRNEAKGLTCSVRIASTLDKPLVLHTDYFYLRGKDDVVRVAADSNNNTVAGVTIPPNEQRTVSVVFRRLPRTPAIKRTAIGTRTIYNLIFNDGDVYVKVQLPF